MICLGCHYRMPRTRFESYRDNPVARLFWGRIPVENAVSYFRYFRGSPYQGLIHALKYAERKDAGTELGRLLGIEIRDSGFACCDLIIPVPLHRVKQLRRGYNQCDPICMGLSRSLGIKWQSGALVKIHQSSSQTDKSRIRRWSNVQGAFRVIAPDVIRDRHILLVDDVVTTGSTLESCANAILGLPGTRISIATLAFSPKAF